MWLVLHCQPLAITYSHTNGDTGADLLRLLCDPLTNRHADKLAYSHAHCDSLPGLYADTNALSYGDPDPEPEPHRPRLPAHADQRRSEKRAPPA